METLELQFFANTDTLSQQKLRTLYCKGHFNDVCGSTSEELLVSSCAPSGLCETTEPRTAAQLAMLVSGSGLSGAIAPVTDRPQEAPHTAIRPEVRQAAKLNSR